MILLFNGCSRSVISVIPKNWKSKNVSVKKPWRIHYRFYDPAFKDDPSMWGKQVALRGMNEFHTISERQHYTQLLIDHETDLLDVQGHNPVTGQFLVPPPEDGARIMDIDPKTPFITALREALKRLTIIKATQVDIESVVRGVEKVSKQLFDTKLHRYYSTLAISQISRKHIKTILDLCGKTRERWSPKRHNMYKCYLSMLFNELLELEAVEFNPTRDIATKIQPFKQREELTPEEMKRVDEHLHANYYAFWRYFKIFFYSGSRTTELLQLRKNKKVNLNEKIFIVRVIKGRQDKEDPRAISNEVLHLWREIWNDAKPGQVLFSKGLVPGDTIIRKDQPGRRWNAHVKIKLGIDKDFYSLKHTHTDAIAEKLDVAHAQAADGHNTPVVTLKHYLKGEKKRQLSRISNAGVQMY